MIKRFAVLAVLAGGLILWMRLRQPRDLSLQIDLTAALPGEIAEVDVVVRRDGRALARHDVQYGKSGAPGLLEILVHAAPGPADVETTLVYAGKPASRTVVPVELDEQVPARVAHPFAGAGGR